jgi:hypothetical protein
MTEGEKLRMTARKLLCGFVLLAGCFLIPSTSYAQAANDNPSVTGQLNDAKVTIAKIKTDAVKMQSYAQNTGLSWQSHATALDKIKADVNTLQQNMRGLQSHRTVASAVRLQHL